MPGDRKHHSEKMRSCVEKVMAEGKDESSAYAICTASLQEAGEEIFEAAAGRHLHLLGATGQARTETIDGREHLVVPVVALIEGVIHAVNAGCPEFVSAAALTKSHKQWDGHPVVVGHPKKEGRQCSAHDSVVLERHGFGLLRNPMMVGGRLGVEAVVDPARLEALGERQLLADLRAGKSNEVSVGAFVTTNAKSGEHNGKAYKAEWVDITPDHLAFLPRERGACSLDMGCGSHRHATEYRVAEEGFVELASKYEDCPMCGGSGNVDGNPCEACEGSGEVKKMASLEEFKAAMGARNSAKDAELIQGVHDYAMSLGATCDRKNYKQLEAAAIMPELKAACRCEEETVMTKEKKAELIAALVTDKYSGYKEGDEPMLEIAPEARLEELRAAAVDRKAEADGKIKMENDLRASTAKLAVIEGKLKVAEQAPTEEEWLARAPGGIKTLLEHQKAQEVELRESLVKDLKTVGANTEEELKAMDIPQLQNLAKYAKVQAPDFSGRGVPVPRGAAAAGEDFTPPDAYAEGLKALQAQSKAVN